MTNEELIMCIKDGNKELMSELYTQNIRLIQIIARKLCADINDYEDAMQDAYIGLAAAVEAYDKDKGAKFMTYAEYHIKLAIRRGKCTARHVPERIRYRAACICKVQNELALQLGRTATKAEISDKTGLTAEQIKHTLDAVAPVRSIYEPLGEDDFTVADTIQDNNIDFENDIAAADEQRFVHDVVEELPEREREALKLYYFYRMTYAQVGKQLHVSGNYARELVKKGIKQLQSPQIKQKFLDDTIDSVTPFYQHRGVQAFNNTWTSVTEKAVLDRERYIRRITV